MNVNGVELHVAVDGPHGAPAVLLLNSLGCTTRMWSPLVARLATDHRVVRFDSRGHGGSAAPPGPYALDDLERDALGVLDALDLDTAAVVGVSMGGLVALALAVDHPRRVTRLVVANSAARIGSAQSWAQRAAAARAGGMHAIADAVIERFFTPDFRLSNPDLVTRFRADLLTADPLGYAACCDALGGADVGDKLADVRAATLVVAGADDVATPVAQSTQLAESIAGSKFVVLPGGHLALVEHAPEFADVVERFLAAEEGRDPPEQPV